ncbi:hypothetical protein IC216_14395 [Clostridioides sp. ES-S-0145-01]|uniref:hypothetical protein n=1 Tax=Clostridioides sp. ES-S-0145-01 TaxID=2770784 RepID=UPI001D0FEC64|nr:hypothetical protein [Clostridioides sp. ES-S-0145-01]
MLTELKEMPSIFWLRGCTFKENVSKGCYVAACDELGTVIYFLTSIEKMNKSKTMITYDFPYFEFKNDSFYAVKHGKYYDISWKQQKKQNKF